MSSSSGTHLATVFSITIALILDVSILLYIKKRYDDDAKAAQEVYATNLQKEKDLREKERLGRISVQKKTRDRLNGENLKLGYQYRPIGFVESPFPDRRGTPRQPVLVPAALGKIRFDKSIIQFEHFKEIIQFSHIWVVFVFHENTNGDTDACQVPARIKPPRLGGQKVGCLSTRSPHRPNAIGLSVCEVVEIGSDFICVSGIDMVDGTPVLDIKPYIPYDSIHLQSEHGLSDSPPLPLPMSVAASSSVFKERRLKVPSWIIDSDIPLHPVIFEAPALEALDDLILDRLLAHCSSSTQAIDLITQVLRQDIRGVHQGRGKVVKIANAESNLESAGPESSAQSKLVVYMCRLDNMLLHFITTETEIRVVSIELYRNPPPNRQGEQTEEAETE